MILRADRVWRSLGHHPVLRGVSLALAAGERLVVLGANGSGKSTLLAVLAGALAPDHGTVELRGSVGFAPERPDLPEHLTAGEWLDVVASLKRDATPAPDLGLAGLLGLRTGALSLGQRQRVSLAAALLGRPTVLVLDEPTNGLDDASRARLVDHLRTATAIVATHDEELAARIATRRVTVRGGRLADQA